MRLTAILFWLSLATLAGYALYHVSFEVETLESRLAELNGEIMKEQEALHVLRAEWSYLNRPDRLAELSRDLLPKLGPIAVHQMMSPEDLPLPGPANPGTAGEGDGEPLATPASTTPEAGTLQEAVR